MSSGEQHPGITFEVSYVSDSLRKKCRAENIVGGALSLREAHKRVCAPALAILRQQHSRRKHDGDSSEQAKEKHTTENMFRQC